MDFLGSLTSSSGGGGGGGGASSSATASNSFGSSGLSDSLLGLIAAGLVIVFAMVLVLKK